MVEMFGYSLSNEDAWHTYKSMAKWDVFIGSTFFCSSAKYAKGVIRENIRTRRLDSWYILDLLKIVFVVTQYSLTMIRNNTVCAAAAIEQTEIVDVGAAVCCYFKNFNHKF